MKNDIPVTTPPTLIDRVSGVLAVTRVQKRPFRCAMAVPYEEEEKEETGGRERAPGGKETIKRSARARERRGEREREKERGDEGGGRPLRREENRADGK